MPQTFLKLKGNESPYKSLSLKVQKTGMTPGSYPNLRRHFLISAIKKGGATRALYLFG
jgi:hypothetical protein